MATKSFFWTTNAAGSGDQQASYSQADLAEMFRGLAEGVIANHPELDALECSDGGANTVDVDTGMAIVDGVGFISSAVENVNIPSASGGGNTRIDRIVVRVDWASFEATIHRIAGTDAGSPTAPVITQTSETTYDLMLCQVLVDTSGNVTVTDERVWALPKERISVKVFPGTQLWSTGDGKFYLPILDPKYEGAILSDVEIACDTPSSSGAVTVQVARGRRASASGAPSYNDMLSTEATIDQDEYTSLDAATPPVIDNDYARVEVGDILRIDVDAAGTDTKGLLVMLEFTL
jgi:hypothetical protein